MAFIHLLCIPPNFICLKFFHTGKVFKVQFSEVKHEPHIQFQVFSCLQPQPDRVSGGAPCGTGRQVMSFPCFPPLLLLAALGLRRGRGVGGEALLDGVISGPFVTAEPSALLSFKCCSLLNMVLWREFGAELLSRCPHGTQCIFALTRPGSRGCLPDALPPHPVIDGCSSQPLASWFSKGTRHQPLSSCVHACPI